MVKVTFHILMKKIQGRLGDSVFSRTHTGAVILDKASDESGVKDWLMNIGKRYTELVAIIQFKIGTG